MRSDTGDVEEDFMSRRISKAFECLDRMLRLAINKEVKSSGGNPVKRKGKEVYLYSAILSSISKRSDMDHTVLPANYTMSAFHS